MTRSLPFSGWAWTHPILVYSLGFGAIKLDNKGEMIDIWHWLDLIGPVGQWGQSGYLIFFLGNTIGYNFVNYNLIKLKKIRKKEF